MIGDKKRNIDSNFRHILKLERAVKMLCNHERVIQDDYKSDVYHCEICNEIFRDVGIPKTSIVCKYACVKK